jgi:methionyl-tRNA synthetase
MSNKTKGKAFYITTTLPYVNADPHVGFGAEIIRADIVARAKILQGYEVFFNTGTDEHGQKLFDEAKKNNEDVKLYVDRFAERFKGLKDLLGLYDGIHFIRTTDKHHIKSAQHFWNLCKANGDIYKKNYKIKYCVGCELEKMESELVDGKCPVHPNRELEIREEENYFFRWSKYQDKLLEFYEKNPDFVLPDFRFNEIKKFVERGLEDFSISRLKSKMSWGIEVPDDSEHVMYVWFDALINYISTLGWPEDIDTFEKFWIEGNPVQYAGKDNLRQQSAMWQAMLMSAGINNTKTIVINGFIQSGGQKMSKSLGNVINPYDVVSVYGKDVLRLYVAKELSWSEDSDMTMERFKDAYNANLANGLGNLVSRVMKMAEGNLQKPVRDC